MPKAETEAWGLFNELQPWLAELPTDASAFGLIHGDFTVGNLRINGGEISLFDFDACCEHWYAYEIAAFLHFFGARDPAARQTAYDHFLAGYADARPVTAAMIGQIPLFGKLRLLYSFLVFAQEWGFEDLSEHQQRYFEIRRKLFLAPPTWPGSRE